MSKATELLRTMEVEVGGEPLKKETYDRVKKEVVQNIEDRFKSALKRKWTLKDWFKETDPLAMALRRYLGAI